MTVESEEEEEEDTGNTPGGNTYECTNDDHCDSNEVCDNLVCVTLECDEGYVASGHECKLKSIYGVSVKSFESEVKVLQGQIVKTNVTVLNTGNKDLAVIMNAEIGVNGVEVNVTPASQTIKVNKTGTFTATFNVSGWAQIGKHPGSFKVTTSFSTAKDTKDFTLVVQPLPEAIAAIEADYLNYTNIVNQLLSDFESFKSQLSAGNLTTLELKVNETVAMFNLLKAAMEEEDYVQAAMYLDQLKGLVNDTRALMNELGIQEGAGSVFWNTLVLWVVVAVVLVGAVGLLIYMMVPTQGYTLGKGYSPQGKSVIAERLKNAFTALRGGTPSRPSTAGSIARKYKMSYDGAYKKLDKAYKPEQTGMAGKVKNVFKRK